jgi:hypothetical protein
MDQVVVTPTNRTPIIEIVNWLCLVTAALAFITHATFKIYASRAVGSETIFVFASLVRSMRTQLFLAAHSCCRSLLQDNPSQCQFRHPTATVPLRMI